MFACRGRRLARLPEVRHRPRRAQASADAARRRGEAAVIGDLPRPSCQYQASKAFDVLLQLLDRDNGYERARDLVDALPERVGPDIEFLQQLLERVSPMSRPALMLAIRFYQEWSYLSSRAPHVDGGS